MFKKDREGEKMKNKMDGKAVACILFVLFSLMLSVSAVSAAVGGIGIPHSASVKVRNATQWDLYEIDDNLVNQDPDPAEPGKYVEIRFKVQNVGGADTEQAIFELVTAYPFSLDPGESAVRKLGQVDARLVGENSYILYYKLRVDKNAIEGNNEIELKYSLNNGKDWTSLPFVIRVRTQDAILSIDDVKTIPSVLPPGKEGQLVITLKNNADSPLKDVIINLGLVRPLQTATSLIYEEMPITPISSSNEKMIEYIDAGQKSQFVFDVAADIDAESKIHKIPINLTYSDWQGNKYSKTQLIGVGIGSSPELVAGVESTDVYSKGDSGEVSVKFVNKGVGNVRFLYVTLKDNDYFEVLSSENVYIGNIDSDDYDTADFKIYLKKVKKDYVELPLIVEYKDDLNNVYEKEYPVKMKVYSSAKTKQVGLKAGSPVVGILIFIVIVAGGIYLYRRWRNNKAKVKKG
jgi:hypothetical protein